MRLLVQLQPRPGRGEAQATASAAVAGHQSTPPLRPLRPSLQRRPVSPIHAALCRLDGALRSEAQRSSRAEASECPLPPRIQPSPSRQRARARHDVISYPDEAHQGTGHYTTVHRAQAARATAAPPSGRRCLAASSDERHADTSTLSGGRAPAGRGVATGGSASRAPPPPRRGEVRKEKRTYYRRGAVRHPRVVPRAAAAAGGGVVSSRSLSVASTTTPPNNTRVRPLFLVAAAGEEEERGRIERRCPNTDREEPTSRPPPMPVSPPLLCCCARCATTNYWPAAKMTPPSLSSPHTPMSSYSAKHFSTAPSGYFFPVSSRVTCREGGRRRRPAQALAPLGRSTPASTQTHARRPPRKRRWRAPRGPRRAACRWSRRRRGESGRSP